MMTAADLPRCGSWNERAYARLLRSRSLLLVVRLCLLALVLAIYSLILTRSPSLRRFLPTVPDLLAAFGSLFGYDAFWRDLATTLAAAGLGLLISLVVGGVLGLLLAVHRHAFGSARFLIDFMRTIPPLALIPVGLLTIGPTVQMEVTLIVVCALWPVLLQTYYGVAAVDPKLLETGRSYRMPLWRRFVFIVVPAIGPTFATAVRLCATLCLLLAIGTELLANGAGLGYLVGWYQQANRVPETYATLIVIGAIAVAVNLALLAVDRRLFAWHRRDARGARV